MLDTRGNAIIIDWEFSTVAVESNLDTNSSLDSSNQQAIGSTLPLSSYHQPLPATSNSSIISRISSHSTESLIGTPGYFSPELLSHQQYAPPCDMYALGVLFGQSLEYYVPGLGLHYLGSKLVLPSTTAYICECIHTALEQQDAGQEAEWPSVLRDAVTLLMALLEHAPEKRITAFEMLNHAFFNAGKEEFNGLVYDCTRVSLPKAREKQVCVSYMRGY